VWIQIYVTVAGVHTQYTRYYVEKDNFVVQ